MRQTRLYSLFRKINGKWVRQSEKAFKKETAIRIWHSRLIDSVFNGQCLELRPVPQTVEQRRELEDPDLPVHVVQRVGREVD